MPSCARARSSASLMLLGESQRLLVVTHRGVIVAGQVVRLAERVERDGPPIRRCAARRPPPRGVPARASGCR
jgi:hypothetical protein